MGLLDDAIREHLDLKRKHGATEEELSRQKTEALGPARRDFAAGGGEGHEADEAPAAADTATTAEPEAEAAREPAGWLEDKPGEGLFDAQAPERSAAPEAAEAPPTSSPPEPIEHAVEAADTRLAEEPVPAPDPLPTAHEPAVPEPRRSDTPAQGFPAVSREDEPPGGEGEPPAEGEEDVLEETPDFLQDTPEHDRLWFEQNPPRDFDFDD